MTTTKPKRPIVAERIALQAIIDDEQSTPKQRLLARMSMYCFDYIHGLGDGESIPSPSEKIIEKGKE